MSAYHTPSAETNPPELAVPMQRSSRDAQRNRPPDKGPAGETAIVAANPREKCVAGGRIHHRPGEAARGMRPSFSDTKGGLIRYPR